MKKQGIKQSSLGTFNEESTSKDTADAAFGSNFQGPTFGSFSEILKTSSVSFSSFIDAKSSKVTSDSKDNDFAQLLKSPVKKKVKAGDESQEEEKEKDFQGENVEWNAVGEAAPWDPESLKTGEEDEANIFSTRCKLFAWVKGETPDGGSWKERGLGGLKLNVSNNNTEIARLGKNVSSFNTS